MPETPVRKQCDRHLSLGLFVSRAAALDQDAFLPPRRFVVKVSLARRTWKHSGALDPEGPHLPLPSQLQSGVVSFVTRRKLGEVGDMNCKGLAKLAREEAEPR